MGMEGVMGNYAQSKQLKAQSGVAAANARVARAQGRATRGRAYGEAQRIEVENEVAGRRVVDNMSRLRGEENKAVGAVQAARGASGFTAEGSGMQTQVSVMKQFEQAAQDMAYSRSLQDQSARFSATMARKSGDIAMMGAEAEGAYGDAQAGIYAQMARNANRAATLSGVLSGVGLVGGAFLGNPVMGMQLGSSMAGLANSMRVGTYENQYGMSNMQMSNLAAGASDGWDRLLSWMRY